MFDHILNELGGLGKEDGSKMGTLAGNPGDFKSKLASDFNAPFFEKVEPLDEDPAEYDGSQEEDSSDSDRSIESKHDDPPSDGEGNQSPSELDDSDYEEMEFENEREYEQEEVVRDYRYNINLNIRPPEPRNSNGHEEEDVPTARSTFRPLRDSERKSTSRSTKSSKRSNARVTFDKHEEYDEEFGDEAEMLTENDVEGGGLHSNYDRINNI